MTIYTDGSRYYSPDLTEKKNLTIKFKTGQAIQSVVWPLKCEYLLSKMQLIRNN